jgi:DinB superfamily
MSTDLKYPIGKYEPKDFSKNQLQQWLTDIKFLPQMVENAILNLDEAQLQTQYREGGWTVHQLIHHIADSHMNAYIRFKLGVTENNPTIKPYDEAAWALLNDTATLPVNISITLLHALHLRWYAVIENFTESDFEKTVFHPEQQKNITLWHLLGMYAWHGAHHVAHITELKNRNNW